MKIFLIKDLLKDDFYELTELEDLLAKKGINKEAYQYFSNSWLTGIGYKTHDINYIIKEEFESLKDVFHNRVLASSVYTITNKDRKMKETTLILFIDNLRQNYLAFSIDSNHLITIKELEKRGIKEADIRKYVSELTKYLEKEKYFTHHSLVKDGYINAHPIFKQFEEYDLPNELIASFIRNVKGVKKTTKGNLYRISRKATTIAEFTNFIKKDQKIRDFEKLKKYIEDNYGFSIRPAN